MDFMIKKAAPREIDAIAGLYGAVCDYLQDKPFNPNWRRDCFPTRENAEEYLAGGGLYAAWDGDALVGSIALNTNPSAEEERDMPSAGAGRENILYIHVAAVHPEHLRRGIGAAMLRFAGTEAAARGANALRLYVWERNEPAIRAYEKAGFVRLGREDIGLREFGLEWFYLYEKRL